MPKSFLLLVMAAGCGLVAMLGLKQMMSDDEGEAPKSVKVLVAKTDIKPFVPLTEELVEFQERPADQIPMGAVQMVEQYERRALRTKAVKGEVILSSKLGEKGDYDASSEIPPGYRVYTVPITATTSHSGQIRPHDRVDIYVTYSSKENPKALAPGLKTKLILDYIEVFAMGADRYSDTGADDEILAKNASLLVTPSQAAILMMAHSKGELSLALRPKNEEDAAEVQPLTEQAFDALGTDFSAREELEKMHQEELDKQRQELTAAHEQELADLEGKTADQIQQTIADIRQKFADDQKRRDDLHAQTLAGLEAKNVELQTLLQRAINEGSDKGQLAKLLSETQLRNKELKKLLEDAMANSSVPLPAVETVFNPETWKIRIVSGRNQSESEFILNEEEKKEKEADKGESEQKDPAEEETSTKNSSKNKNPATEPTKLAAPGT